MPHQCQRKLRHYAAKPGEINNLSVTKDNGRYCCAFKYAQFTVCMYIEKTPKNLCVKTQNALEPTWKPVFFRHHHDVRPRDCTVGGDNERKERRDEDSEPLLHQHFPAEPQVKVTRSISMIILWRDQKYVLIKNDCCWRVNDSSEFD